MYIYRDRLYFLFFFFFFFLKLIYNFSSILLSFSGGRDGVCAFTIQNQLLCNENETTNTKIKNW
jgi:predicted phosphoadenosine phosphosulfate sulfurtransferase